MKSFFYKYYFLFIGLAVLIIGLTLYFLITNRKAQNIVQLSFYSWQNRFALDSSQCKFIEQHHVNHLHIKLFELSLDESSSHVIVNNTINPYPSYKACKDFFLTHTLTPVIFIDNNLFYKTDSLAIREMAGLVKRALIIHSAEVFQPDRYWDDRWHQLYFSMDMPESKTDSLNEAYQLFKKNITSYEFDCDWTAQTKNNYFYFLQQVKDSLHKKTEATLRLHQYKYRKETGIPPVDVVNLMCYNMGEVTQEKEKNSIFNTALLKQYIKGQEPYPLPLNIALPTFSWVAVFRNNKFLKLIPSASLKTTLEQSYSGIEKIDTSNFRVTDDFYYDWTEESLKSGDHLRVEKIDMKTLMKGYDMLMEELKTTPKEVILFDLNNTSKTEDFDELAKHINH